MKDAYYFSHDSNARNDQRILEIRMKHGMTGYGVYFGIIEILREQTDYSLHLNKFTTIAYDLRVDYEMVEDIIMNYNLFEIDDNIWFSRSLKRRMERLDVIKQKRSVAGRKGGKSKASDNQMLNKERKEKDNIVNKNIVKEITVRYDSFLNHLKQYESEFGKETIIEFFNYWTEPNKSNTKMKFEMQPTWDTKRRIQRWVGNDFSSNKTNGVSKFKLDSSGNAYIAYCNKCGVSEFYAKEELSQDSKCCKDKLLHEKPIVQD